VIRLERYKTQFNEGPGHQGAQPEYRRNLERLEMDKTQRRSIWLKSRVWDRSRVFRYIS
jgi:hypothetical protein